MRTELAPGPWLRLSAFVAAGGTLLAVVSGAEGLGTAHRLLAAHVAPPLAALARYNPLAVVPVAVLIGALQNAGNTLQGADFPSGLVGVMQGIILFSALGGELLVRYRLRFRRRAPEAAPAVEPAA